ncbi:phosphoribosylaminoimidazole carboxylase [uncultured Polaribacter sp.]|uniref:phosphoribosylaminoimidazole carboxylase n=1 Tax=uncultured Polaribacter sp. TaxID=174711 RepID=UPI0026051F06|nr:phosphoribosylaminoimidazole carboxylase [uncultured Polaribacter sp.]
MIKNVFILICIIFLTSCSSNDVPENCLRTDLPLNITTDLNNPQLINAQTPGGFVDLVGGINGVLLFNKNGNDFVAFDKLCPQNDCDAPMTFEKGLVLTCACDNSEYSVHFGGAPQTDGFECAAREYRVLKNGSSIRITNF